MRHTDAVPTVLVIALIAAASAVAGFYVSNGPTGGIAGRTGTAGVVQVVAAENFWGSLAAQLGGARTHVQSIVSDPNADPHEYASSTASARAISGADLVIVNGAGYDQWALKLIGAAANPDQEVLDVQELLGQPIGANPHFWYSPRFVNETVRAIYDDLVQIDPGGGAYYRQQYVALNSSLGEYNAVIHEIAGRFSGTRIASTEDIFAYLANAANLDLVSPPAFMQAVSEGNDPPASSVVQFQQLLDNRSVAALVVNAQTVTPLTQSMRALAANQTIPIVSITETVQPPDVAFQAWMYAELLQLQNALSTSASGR